MDPGQADSPNTQRDVPTVMGPVSSAANIDYLTPTTYQRQLPESSPATTISYVPAEELESSVQGREVPQTGSAASYSLNSPSHEDPLLPREGDQFVMDIGHMSTQRILQRSDSVHPSQRPAYSDNVVAATASSSVIEPNFGSVRPEDFLRTSGGNRGELTASAEQAVSESPGSRQSSVNLETLDGMNSEELENFMELCQQKYQQLNPNVQPPYYSRQSVEMAADLLQGEMRPKMVSLNPGNVVPNFESEAPILTSEFNLPTVEEILSSPGWFTFGQWNALSDRDRQAYWRRALEYRESLRAGMLSNALHRVYNPAHTKSKADAEYRELFAKRGREDLRYMTLPPEASYQQRRRQDYAEAKMTSDGNFVPLAGNGNEDNALDGGFVRGDTYAPSSSFRDKIGTPSSSPAPAMAAAPSPSTKSAVNAKVRNVFSKTKGSTADSVVGKFKGNPAFWSTLDPRDSAFNHVHMIQMSINWIQMKGAFEYICAALIGKLVLRDESLPLNKNEIREFVANDQLRVTVYNEITGFDNVTLEDAPVLSGHARRLVRNVLEFAKIVHGSTKLLKAPTVMAEALHRFKQENDRIQFVADAETAAEIDARLKAAQWEQSSTLVRESLFGPAAEVTFLEVFLRMLNDPFSTYKAVHHVEALEAEIRAPKPAGMTHEAFHRQFRQKLEQHKYANENHAMFPTEQKAMACLVRCYSNYPKVTQVLSTFATVCSVQGTVAPWMPNSTSTWKLKDLMKYIEEHSELNANVNPLLSKPTGSSPQEEKTVNALTTFMEQFQRMQRPSDTGSAIPRSANAAVLDDKAKSEKGLKFLAKQVVEKWKKKSDDKGNCKQCGKHMPAAGPDAGGPNDCKKCKKCMMSCKHNEDNCPYDASNSKSYKQFKNGEKEYEWPKDYVCPKCGEKHPGKTPIQCTGQLYMKRVQRQKDILAGKQPSWPQTKSVNFVDANDVTRVDTNHSNNDFGMWKAFKDFAEASTEQTAKTVNALVSSAAVKLLCSVASNRTDLVLIDHGAEVSIHGHPKHSVGLLTTDPSVSLQGPLGDAVSHQQGHCKQRYDTLDADGRIVCINVVKSYYCPGVARCSIAAGCDLRSAGWSFHDSSHDVLVEIADQLHLVPANMPTLINNHGVQIPLQKIPGSDLLWVKLIDGDTAPVMTNSMGIQPANPKIAQTISKLNALAAATCAMVTGNFNEAERYQALPADIGMACTDAERAYYQQLSLQGVNLDATGTNLERDAVVPTFNNDITAAHKKLIAVLQQKCDIDLASMSDTDVIEKGKGMLPLCYNHLGTISGFEPVWWLEYLVEPGSKAYLLRMALTALKESQQSSAEDFANSDSLSKFRDACALVSSEAANVLQLMSKDFLADFESSTLNKD